jgi:hypothetical protein
VVRAYVEAVNARDKAKFVSLWSPDYRDHADWAFDNTREATIQYVTIKTIVVRDSIVPGQKEVYLEATIEIPGTGEILDHRSRFIVERLDGRWCIQSTGSF